jgi:hypothetical protein
VFTGILHWLQCADLRSPSGLLQSTQQRTARKPIGYGEYRPINRRTIAGAGRASSSSASVNARPRNGLGAELRCNRCVIRCRSRRREEGRGAEWGLWRLQNLYFCTRACQGRLDVELLEPSCCLLKVHGTGLEGFHEEAPRGNQQMTDAHFPWPTVVFAQFFTFASVQILWLEIMRGKLTTGEKTIHLSHREGQRRSMCWKCQRVNASTTGVRRVIVSRHVTGQPVDLL